MKHPFEIGQTSDRVLYLEKRDWQYRCAKNKIVGLEGGYVVIQWFFESCTLEFAHRAEGYQVQKILPALDTGRRFSTAKAALSGKEAREQTKEFKHDKT